MDQHLIKANLNLYAVLQNLEDLVRLDSETGQMVRDWNISIQFTVRRGPSAYLVFEKGACRHGRGKIKRPSILLYFFSPAHCNKMFEDAGTPLILKGFSKLMFLLKEFPALTDRLEYFLKPDDELLKDKAYLDINTPLTLNTAAYAVRELALLEPTSRIIAHHVGAKSMVLKILPDGPAVTLNFNGTDVDVLKGEEQNPSVALHLKNMKLANRFFNGQVDTYTAVATGDVVIKGLALVLESVSLILNRVPLYLA